MVEWRITYGERTSTGSSPDQAASWRAAFDVCERLVQSYSDPIEMTVAGNTITLYPSATKTASTLEVLRSAETELLHGLLDEFEFGRNRSGE